MIIDIISDLHFDYYFKGKPTENVVRSIYSHIFLDNGKREVGTTLVIAGDLGHKNKQTIMALKLIKEIFGYKYIVCVLGNHDYLLMDNDTKEAYFHKSHFRAERMRALINKEEGMYCLDGNMVTLDGVRFGGCDSWYDGEYIKENFDKFCPMHNCIKDDNYINELWENTMFESEKLFDFNWMEHAKGEKTKLDKIYKEVDVMLTHVNPSIIKRHTSANYRDSETTGFFTFNGLHYLAHGSMKYWVFGHTHTEIDYELFGVKCICNPMGYPNESGNGEWTLIKHIEI